MGRIVKPVPVEIDGTEYQVELSLASVWDFEEFIGRPFLEVAKPLLEAAAACQALKDAPEELMEIEGLKLLDGLIEKGAVTGKILGTIVWACLGGMDSGMKPRDAAKLVKPRNAIQVFSACFAAMKDFLPGASTDGAQETQDPNPN